MIKTAEMVAKTKPVCKENSGYRGDESLTL